MVRERKKEKQNRNRNNIDEDTEKWRAKNKAKHKTADVLKYVWIYFWLDADVVKRDFYKDNITIAVV